MSKIKSFSLCFFVFLVIAIRCEKETSNTPEESNSTLVNNTPNTNTSNTNNTSNTEEDTLNPNLNENSLTFEVIEVTFFEEDLQPTDRSSGNWGRFGGIGSDNLTVTYAENMDSSNENESLQVLKITEPSGVQPWAGFYFILEEKIVFPEGKEALSLLFYSPGPGHKVLLKLEDELPNDSPGKKTTGDLIVQTTGTGWEKLVFNIPQLDGRNGIYNTITLILGYDLTNQTETYYFIDNLEFSARADLQIDPQNIDVSEDITVYDDYQLVWNDEFNYEGTPSSEKWHHQYIPLFNGGWANDEKQHYTARLDNSFVSEGTLKIVAKREDYTYEGSRKSFTSARLNSKFSFLYGRIDVRAKLPTSQGTWPAIWTLGTNIGELGNYYGTTDGNVGWPSCGEIDIMEQEGGNKQILYGTFHWAGGGGQPASYGLTKDISSIGITNVTSTFHLYSLIWNSSSIKVMVDNILIAELANTGAVPFDNPHYLLLNIAMGGTLGGTVPGSFSEDTMEIDYVRFYQ